MSLLKNPIVFRCKSTTATVANASATVTSTSNSTSTSDGSVLDDKRKDMAKGPDLGDFISGVVPKGQNWMEYKGNLMIVKGGIKHV
jgi:hypothetical protein